MENSNELQIAIITGMSGAGKTVAIQSFEDLGFFCVDNLPPMLLPKFLELMRESNNKMNRVALVMDLRGREFFDHLFQVLDDLENTSWLTPHIVFLDADNETLVRRYKETRRSHPLSKNGLLLDGIQQERKLLENLLIRPILSQKNCGKKFRRRFLTVRLNYLPLILSPLVLSMGFRSTLTLYSMFVFYPILFISNQCANKQVWMKKFMTM